MAYSEKQDNSVDIRKSQEQALKFTTPALLITIPVGLLIAAIPAVNNFRDIPTDRLAGKRKPAVMLGKRGARIAYLVIVFLRWPGSK